MEKYNIEEDYTEGFPRLDLSLFKLCKGIGCRPAGRNSWLDGRKDGEKEEEDEFTKLRLFFAQKLVVKTRRRRSTLPP